MRIVKSISRRIIRVFGTRKIYRRRGMLLLLDPSNQVDFRIAARLAYEDEQMDHARELVKKHDLTRFLDVGANIGLYTISIAQLPQVKHVDAFEPVRSNFNQLCANIFINELNAKVNPHHLALGSTTGTVLIHVMPESTGCSRINAGCGGNPADFTRREEIEIRPFDSYLSVEGERMLVKIDVEGHAVDVLRGMSDTLKKNFAVIQVEMLPFDREEIISILNSLGYRLVKEIDVDGIFLPDSCG